MAKTDATDATSAEKGEKGAKGEKGEKGARKPRKTFKKRGEKRIVQVYVLGLATDAGNHRLAEVPLALQIGRNGSDESKWVGVRQPHEVNKKEHLVFSVVQVGDHHRAADRAATLVEAIRGFLEPIKVVIHPGGIQGLVPQIIVKVSVERIGAALGAHRDDSLGGAGIGGKGVGRNADFLERVCIGHDGHFVPTRALH